MGFLFIFAAMYVTHNSLSENAKVWVYPSSRKFYPQEIDGLKEKLHQFISEWKVNENAFKASFEIKYNRFVIFYAEDNVTLSNADIDAQVGCILALQQDYEIELLDKMNVCFKQGEFIQYKTVKDFKKLLKSKSVNDKTIVFDNLIQTKYELENFWEVPITESWYNRFL